jgi:two-component sensor histidine kinase
MAKFPHAHDVQVKEVHHRIKNNLQIICSLLDLQAEDFKNKQEMISCEDVVSAFRKSYDRVLSMALIHEELYISGDLTELSFSSYLTKLTQHLLASYSVGSKDIKLNIDLADNIFFDMDITVPLGMIVNELVTNSFKHAFIDHDSGEISVILSKGSRNGDYMLQVSDDGGGIDESISVDNLESLGMQIVMSLVDQLDGILDVDNDNGTIFTLLFSINHDTHN